MMSIYKHISVKVCEVLSKLNSFNSIIAKVSISKRCPSFSTSYLFSLEKDILSWYRMMFISFEELNYPSILVENDFIVKSKADFTSKFKYFIMKQLNSCFELEDYFHCLYPSIIRYSQEEPRPINKKNKSRTELIPLKNKVKLVCLKLSNARSFSSESDPKKKQYLSKDSILKNKGVKTMSSSQVRTPKSLAFSINQAKNNKACITNELSQLSIKKEKLDCNKNSFQDLNRDSKKSLTSAQVTLGKITYEMSSIMRLLKDFEGSSSKQYYIGLRTTEDQDTIFHGQYNRLNGKKMGLGLLVKNLDQHSSEESIDNSILLQAERKKTILSMNEKTPRKMNAAFHQKSLYDKIKVKMTSIDPLNIVDKPKIVKPKQSTISLSKANIHEQSIYLGFFQDDVYNGYGMSLSSCCETYFGEYRQGKQNGFGIEKVGNHEYSGTFVDSKFCGYGDDLEIKQIIYWLLC